MSVTLIFRAVNQMYLILIPSMDKQTQKDVLCVQLIQSELQKILCSSREDTDQINQPILDMQSLEDGLTCRLTDSAAKIIDSTQRLCNCLTALLQKLTEAGYAIMIEALSPSSLNQLCPLPLAAIINLDTSISIADIENAVLLKDFSISASDADFYRTVQEQDKIGKALCLTLPIHLQTAIQSANKAKTPLVFITKSLCPGAILAVLQANDISLNCAMHKPFCDSWKFYPPPLSHSHLPQNLLISGRRTFVADETPIDDHLKASLEFFSSHGLKEFQTIIVDESINTLVDLMFKTPSPMRALCIKNAAPDLIASLNNLPFPYDYSLYKKSLTVQTITDKSFSIQPESVEPLSNSLAIPVPALDTSLYASLPIDASASASDKKQTASVALQLIDTNDVQRQIIAIYQQIPSILQESVNAIETITQKKFGGDRNTPHNILMHSQAKFLPQNYKLTLGVISKLQRTLQSAFPSGRITDGKTTLVTLDFSEEIKQLPVERSDIGYELCAAVKHLQATIVNLRKGADIFDSEAKESSANVVPAGKQQPSSIHKDESKKYLIEKIKQDVTNVQRLSRILMTMFAQVITNFLKTSKLQEREADKLFSLLNEFLSNDFRDIRGKYKKCRPQQLSSGKTASKDYPWVLQLWYVVGDIEYQLGASLITQDYKGAQKINDMASDLIALRALRLPYNSLEKLIESLYILRADLDLYLEQTAPKGIWDSLSSFFSPSLTLSPSSEVAAAFQPSSSESKPQNPAATQTNSEDSTQFTRVFEHC